VAKQREQISYGGLSARLGFRNREKQKRRRRHSMYEADVEMILQRIRSDANNWVMQVEAAVERVCVLDDSLPGKCVAIVLDKTVTRSHNHRVKNYAYRFCGRPAYYQSHPRDEDGLGFKVAFVPLCRSHLRGMVSNIQYGIYGYEENQNRKLFNNQFFKRFEERYGERIARLVLTQLKGAVKRVFDGRIHGREEADDVAGDGPEADNPVR
jgi:hypothetical protein